MNVRFLSFSVHKNEDKEKDLFSILTIILPIFEIDLYERCNKMR